MLQVGNILYHFLFPRLVDGGASTNPCAQDYRGPSVQSEIEVRSLTNYISALTNVQVYIDMHCYSQLWMFPFGYKYDYAGNYWDQVGIQEIHVFLCYYCAPNKGLQCVTAKLQPETPGEPLLFSISALA